MRTRRQIPKIQNGGSNMAGKNFEKLTIFMKIGIYEFLRSLIANPSSDSQN